MRCGVLVYLHVPKTGGSAVTRFLQHYGGTHGWWHTTINTQTPWPTIAERVRLHRRPKQIVIHHVDAPMALSNETVLARLDCSLRAQGCRLVRTTVLRDAASRATSAATYNRVPHVQYASWVAEHATNGMIAYLLHNRLRLRRHNHTLPMTTAELHRARSFLADFDAVGRAEDLRPFFSYLLAVLAPMPALPANAPARINETPEQHKYELSPEERAWVREHTALDAQLYGSLCADADGQCSAKQVSRRQKCPAVSVQQ